MLNEQVSETIFSQFDEVERRVEQLVQKIKTIETENEKLRTTIEDLEKQLKKREVAEKQYVDEKAKVRNKINALLEKIGYATAME